MTKEECSLQSLARKTSADDSDARKLEVLADSYDGYRFTTVKDLAIGQGDDLFVSSPFSATVYRIRPKRVLLEF